MFDRINIKAVIISMATAAALSLASGGMGGVSMGALLFRALLFGLCFGFGAIIINMVVRAFLPELIDPEREQIKEEEDDDRLERGRNVNIVMDDDNESPGMSEEPVISDGESDDSGLEDDVQDFATADRGFKPVSAQDITGQKRGPGLPDIGSFAEMDDEDEGDTDSDSYQSVNATEAPGSDVIKSRFADIQSKDEDKIEFFQNNTNAEELAKGVRTMLKRDEKG